MNNEIKNCEYINQTHDYEKVIKVKIFNNIGKLGFIWKRCKKCGYLVPSMFPTDFDSKGNPLSCNFNRVRKAHPDLPIVEDE